MCICMHLRGGLYTRVQAALEAGRVCRSSGAAVTSLCEALDVGAGNETEFSTEAVGSPSLRALSNLDVAFNAVT